MLFLIILTHVGNLYEDLECYYFKLYFYNYIDG